MLTLLGRVAARRLLAPAPSQLTTSLAARALANAFARKISVRSFSHSFAARNTAAARGRAKKPAARKRPTAKKPKAKPKKKAVKAKKPKAVKKPKKVVLTTEEKEKKEARDLKKLALLRPPTGKPTNVWSVFLAQNSHKGEGGPIRKVKEIAARYKTLSTSEKNKLESAIRDNKESNTRRRQAWIKSHPPEQVLLANIARRRLARMNGKNRLYLIHDDRLPARPRNGYSYFVKSRFDNVGADTTQETFRQVAKEWRSLTESQKKPFLDSAAVEKSKHAQQNANLRSKAKQHVRIQTPFLSNKILLGAA